MIRKVEIKYFKKFKSQTFETDGNVVLAGPNNSGKSTLLQAITVWDLALRKWLDVRGVEGGSKAKIRTGVPVSRKDFTAVPLRELNLLWNNRDTALSKLEVTGTEKPGAHRLIEIHIHGGTEKKPWVLGFAFRYSNTELLHVKPIGDKLEDIIPIARAEVRVVHVPPFSGIGSEETRYDSGYQDLLIGQGKPGDILRNLLFEVYDKNKEGWNSLTNDVRDIFGYKLLAPEYDPSKPHILCEYLSGGGIPKLDISNAGSGFLQVLILLSFMYARPATALLLDEPDAHMHVILQKDVYDRLRLIARRLGCQLLLATHSEVLIENTSPDQVISFYRDPHKLLSDIERDQVREALKRLSSLDILLAEQSNGVLYLEGESDYDLLREWSKILNHPLSELFKEICWHPIRGRNPRNAKAHLFAVRAIKPDANGILLLDGDDRNLPDREVTTDGLTIIRWTRYESENYLIHPRLLERFVRGPNPDLFSDIRSNNAMQFLRDTLPPSVLREPTGIHDYLNATPASKTILPGLFSAAEIQIRKNEYYQIASQMNRDEIAMEVTEKLDIIHRTLFP